MPRSEKVLKMPSAVVEALDLEFVRRVVGEIRA
jgi:hypothetical protein